MSKAITLENITKTFKEEGKSSTSLLVLDDINLEIDEGEFFVLVGPSGSGKSTLLRIISGLEKDFKGKVRFGDHIKPENISFVFQQFALMPWLSVVKNVEFSLISRDITEAKRHELAMLQLQKLGLENFANHLPKELSGGMRQRVGIARALVTEPKIIFMDEPFSELDSFTAEELRQEMLQIWNKTKITVVMVTHLIPEAIELADSIAVLTSRPGKLEAVVKNNLPRRRKLRSAEFFKLEDEIYQLIKP